MPTQNSSNQKYSNNADGFTLGGGSTQRNFSISGGNITLTNSGTQSYAMPASSDTIVGRASTDTLTNKTLTAPALSGTITGTYTLGGTPTFPSTVVTTTGTQTLTNKTLTTPIISSISNSGTITLPTGTQTLVGRTTTDTLTNKTISGSSNTLSNIPISALSATGTASSSTYLRGDGTWSTQAGTTWGGITGTLSNQTDLQTALDAKAGLQSTNTYPQLSKVALDFDTYRHDSTIVPPLINDLAFNNLKGGSTSVTLNASPGGLTSIDNVFRPDASAASNSSVSTNDIIEITITCHKSIRYEQDIGILMSQTWRARDVKIEVYYGSAWYEIYNVTGSTNRLHSVHYDANGINDIAQIRYTLTNFTSTLIRVISLYSTDYDSELLSAAYMSLEGGTIYGQISNSTDPSSVDHLARKGYVDSGTATLTNKTISGSSNTLSNIALTSLASSTSTALGVGSLELGHASDTTLSRASAGRLAVEGVNIPTVSSTDTLTNKTLTAPVLSGTITGTYTLGGTPTFPSTVVTTTGTQTLTNKTLTTPVATALSIGSSQSASNFIVFEKTVASSESNLPRIRSDSLISPGIGNDLILSARSTTGGIVFETGNTGVRQLALNASGDLLFGTSGDTNLFRSAANTLKTDDTLIVGIPGTVTGSAVTIDGTQTLTNKTMSGSSNTFSNIPASAITGLNTDFSRLVVTTADGGTGTEDGADTWAKIATFSTGTSQNHDCNLILGVSVARTSSHDSAIISVKFRSSGTGANPVVGVEMLAKGGNGNLIDDDSFKVISGGWSTDMELWVRKGHTFGTFYIYEISRSISGSTLTYTTTPAWQSATPTGAVNNVSTAGVTVSGLPVATTTGSQTLTNKSITDPFITGSLDFNDVTGKKLMLHGSDNYVIGVENSEFRLSTSSGGAFRFYSNGYASGSETMSLTNVGLLTTASEIRAGSAGTQSNSVVTNAGTQTLTNKTVTAPVLSGTITGTYTLGGTPTFPSTVVMTTGAQTLASKTLTTPTIASFTNATHNHTNAAGGGQLTASTALSATGTPSSSTYLRGDNTWSTITAGDASTNTSTSVDGEVALFTGTGGKTFRRATATGIATLSSGVLGAVAAPSGAVVGTTDTQTLTNKTISATNNTFTNIASALTSSNFELLGSTSKTSLISTASIGVANPFSVLAPIYNDIMHHTLQGGTVTVTKNGSPASSPADYNGVDYAFTPHLEAMFLYPSSTSDTFVIEVDHSSYHSQTWGSTYGIEQRAASYAAQDITIEAWDSVTTSWISIGSVTNSVGNYANTINNGNARTKIRYTLTNFGSTSGARINSLFVVNSGSALLSNAYIPRTGGTLIGGHINDGNNPTSDDNLTRRGYVNSGTATLTNKTLSAPVLSGTITGTYTFGGNPTFPSSMVTTTSTQTLSNKTLASPVITGDLSTTSISRFEPIVIRGSGNNHSTNRLVKIGDVTAVDAGGRGLNLVIVSKADHSVVSATTYDVYGGGNAAKDDLATALDAITNAQIGILTSFDAWESGWTSSLSLAFLKLGLTKAYVSNSGPGIRSPYAAIFEGTTTVASGKVVEVELSNDASAPYAEIRGWLIDGSFSVAGSVPNALYNSRGTVLGVLVEDNNNVNLPNGNFQIAGTTVINTSGILQSSALSGTYSNAVTLSSASNSFTGNGSGLTSLSASNISTGTLTVARGGTGATTLTGIVKGNGTGAFTAVTAPSGAIVGTTDAQTLTNKTLTNPLLTGGIDYDDTVGKKLMLYGSDQYVIGIESSEMRFAVNSNAVYRFYTNGYSAGTEIMSLTSAGLLTTLGEIRAGTAGTQSNSVVTNAGTQTLTNKTIDGGNNTLTNIPASAITGLNTDFARLVVDTQGGSTGAEDGADTWAHIATYSTGTNPYSDAAIILAVTNEESGNHDTAIVSVKFRSQGTSSNPAVDVQMLSKGGNGDHIEPDSFKVISDGWSSDMELWFRKGANYGHFRFYELAANAESTLTYESNPGWQSATPTGSVNNVSSNGVTAFGQTIWHAGNDGTGSGLDADLLDGMDAVSTATASTIMARDSNADATVRYLHSQHLSMSHGAGARTTDTVFFSSNDNYIRKNNASGFKTSLALNNVDNTADASKSVLSAAQLTTARNIGGVSFNGTANINLPGVNIAGNQNTSGNAATATTLQTARTINGVSFNGSANITVYDSTKLPLTGGTTSGMIVATTTGTTADDWSNSPISIRERGVVGNAQSGDEYAPNLNFHWGSTNSNSLWMDASGRLNWGGYSSGGVPSYTGTIRASTFIGDLSGNATTATSATSATTANTATTATNQSGGTINATTGDFTSYMRTDEIRNRTGTQLVINSGDSQGVATGQTGELVYLNSEGGIEVNASPDNWGSGWAGRVTTNINASGISWNGNTVWHAGNDGSGSGLDADTLDGNQASAFPTLAGNNTFTGGNLITVQNAQDGGTGRGIFMWNDSDTNWGIYMGTAGASKSLAGATAASGIDGRTGHGIRFRVNTSASNIGFLWENSADTALMQLTTNTGNLYTLGDIYVGNSTSNKVITSTELQTISASLRANRNLNGGGTITVNGSYYVHWSSRFIVIANGRGSYFSTAGYFDINCPTSGTVTGVGGASNKTATSAGIPLDSWEALYYIMPIGSGNNTVAANFRVARYTADADIPHDWLLICVRNGDSPNVVTFNNGITLSAGESMSKQQQDTANTANTLVKRDGSGNFSAGTITATLSGNATTATTATYVTSGMPNNTDNYMNFRVIRNNNSSTSNDGLYLGYGNSNSGNTYIYGGGDTSNRVTFSTGAAIYTQGLITGSRFTSSVSTGTAPLTVSSTTVVSNLNADMLDGQHASAFVTASGAQTLTNKTFNDDSFTIQDNSDNSKKIEFSLDGMNTSSTITLQAPNVTSGNHTLVVRNSADVLKNKRIEPRVTTVASSATPSFNTDNTDLLDITALATNITSMTSSMSGTPTNGEKILIRIKDNGTPRSITWGASWRGIGVSLPIVTTASKTLYIGATYNSNDSIWDVIAVEQQA